jgi:hypothetical protein
MPFFFAFPSSFDLYPFSFSPPVSTSTIRLSDLTHDIVELSLPCGCDNILADLGAYVVKSRHEKI